MSARAFRFPALLITVALVSSFAGCSCGDQSNDGTESVLPPDGSDAGPDASILSDAGPDAGSDAGSDASVEGDAAVIVPTIEPTNVDPAAPSSIDETTSFLYDGPNPAQVGVDAGTIDPKRVVVLHGQTLNPDGTPLPGVEVTAPGRPELGVTHSRATGEYDFAANGGTTLDLAFRIPGRISAHRHVRVGWREFAAVPDVVMIPRDIISSHVVLGASALQAARGSPIQDGDGARQATLIVPPGVHATLHGPSGSQSLTSLTVRATEFTVGADGPKRMPAALPATSGYTYALELTADEADASGGDITFDQPLYHYVENFLGFPVGSPVPVGYFDRVNSRWVASKNGKVIKVLSVDAGMATLDTDGDGAADSAATLSALGITDGERQTLGGLYSAGQTLWRVPIPHFSPWDCNWPYGPPDDAEPPKVPPPDPPKDEDDSDKKCGSIIDCQNQSLGESLPIAGTPLALRYSSARHASSPATLIIPLSGATLPASLKRIELEIQIAGRTVSQTFPATPNQTHVWTWDGLDSFGRKLYGRQPALVRVGYVYPAVYHDPMLFEQSFGRFSGVPLTGNQARQELTIWQETHSSLAAAYPDATALGGWSVNVHHAFDPEGHVLLLGDGSSRSEASLQTQTIQTVAGTRETLIGPSTLVTAPDGSAYFLDVSSTSASAAGGLIKRIAPDGTVTTVAGNGSNEFSGDGGPALSAGLGTANALAVGPDGSLYIGSGRGVHPDCRIRRVGPDGIIQTVLGHEVLYQGYLSSCCSTEPDNFRPPCEDGLGTDVILGSVQSIAVAADGTIHFVDDLGLRTLGTDGYVTRASATAAMYPDSVTLAPDGSLYLTEMFGVSRLWPDGRLTRVAGHGADYSGHMSGTTTDGALALQAQVYVPKVAVSRTGEVVIADATHYDRQLIRVRALSPDGHLKTFAGLPAVGATEASGAGDCGPATQARLTNIAGVAFDADRAVYLVDADQKRIRKVQGPWAGWGAGGIPSTDGSEIYIFSLNGRHDRTVDAVTGAVRWEFGYDTAGLLGTIRDGQGNVTRIERDGPGRPTAIVSPFGVRTVLSVNAEGWLGRVTDPLGKETVLGYGPRGLLTSLTDPRNASHTFTYDAAGRLQSDSGPNGSGSTLARTESAGGYVATITTAMGRVTEYKLERTATGDQLTTTAPSGEQTVEFRGTDDRRITTHPDGMVLSELVGPDPRFGMVVPLRTALTVTTPGGLQLTQQFSRTVALTDPGNPLSVVTLRDATAVNGASFVSLYDASSRTLTTTTPMGRWSAVTYDTQGRPTTFTVPGIQAIQVTYDSKGRMGTLSQGTRTTTLGYGTDGALSSITDPLNQTVTLVRDGAGRVTSMSAPGNRTVALGRDAAGNLTQFTPPGKPSHALGYDLLGQVTTYTPPLTGAAITSFSFNADREQTGVTVTGQAGVSLTYDAGGRPDSMVMPGRTITVARGASDGRITSLTASDGGALTFSYDGALLTTVTLSGAVTGSVQRTFDNALRVSSEQVNGANEVTFSYDLDGLLVQAGVLTVQHSSSTPAVSGTTLGIVSETRQYDAYGDLETAAWTVGGNATYRNAVVRDALGRLSTRTETVLGQSHTWGYTYDAAGRLTDVTLDGAAYAHHGHDDNGNRTLRRDAGGDVIGIYDGQDRMTSWGGATYAYGLGGELTTRTRSGTQVTRYEYDLLGELKAVTLPDATRIEYVLDANERRVGRKVNGALQKGWLYGVGRRPLAELNAANQVVSRFVYGTNPDVPDYVVKGGSTYRIITDLLGSPRLVVNSATGAVAQRLDYDEQGRVTQDTQPGFQPFGFAGGFYDPDTGLVRFGARDYDPESGRFTARDPALFLGRQTNLYAYADGDPINLIDRSGLAGELATPQFSAWDIFKMGWRSTFGSWGQKALDDSAYGTYKSVDKVANHLNTTIPNYRMMEANLALLNNPNRCGEAVDSLVERNRQQQVVIQDTAEAAGRAYDTAYSTAVGKGLGDPVDVAKDAALEAAPGLFDKFWKLFQ